MTDKLSTSVFGVRFDMAGPVAGVLVREPVDPAGREYVGALVQALSGTAPNETVSGEGSFWISTGTAIDAAYTGEGRPFSLHYDTPPESYAEPGTTDEMEKALGYLPPQEILIVAYCNGAEDHLLLGRLVLTLAKRFGGVVNMGGPVETAMGRDEDDPEAQAIKRSLPGKCYEVSYEIDEKRRGSFHVVDTTFLDAWLAHPRFRMVK
ncbi:MAG TPA: DUF6368 family protein [Planctomycetota bacterium]|nr:DUF6368 family protein [Planctomycetota bacterium]